MADSASYPGVPRWVKVFGVTSLVVVLLFVVLHLGGHGPGEHTHGSRPGPLGDHGVRDQGQP